MAKNRIFYALTVLACLIFSMAYTGRISFILLMTVLCYPVLAFILAVIHLLCVRADFCDNRVSAPKETLFNIKISVRNNFIFPAVPIELMCGLPDEEIGLFADKRIFVSLPPFGKTELHVRSKHKFRGNYTAEIKRIYVVDPLRIIRVSKKCRNTLSVTVLPRKLELQNLLFRSAVEQSFSQKQLNSADKEDFSHVREYRDGDILQMVHWKLTAKHDDLMTKQFDSISDLRAVILCDYHQSNDTNGMAYADMIIETAIAFVKAALDKGIHSTVDFGDPNTAPQFINDAGTFDAFYELMSVIPPDIETESFCPMIDEIDKSRAAILVMITPEINEDILERARSAAHQVTVFYAYLNIENRPLEYDFSDERFLFLNILGTDENALNNAADKLVENTGEQ